MKLPLGVGDYSRTVAGTPDINLVNRYFETDPTNQDDQVALLTRPALRKWLEVGTGPIRAVYSCPGAFSEALFVVSGTTLYKIATDETITSIGTVAGTSHVSMAATDFPHKLWIANGLGLQLYDGSTLSTVTVPDDDGIVSVGFIAQFVICVVAQGFDKNGRFYWIQSGAITIDALDFATAERSPDPVWEVVIVGDQFWLPGTSTNEIWYPTGDALAPFLRVQGRLFDKGIWEGTIIKIKDDVMAVGTDGTVYRIGAEPVVVSTPGIAQRLRQAIDAQRAG